VLLGSRKNGNGCGRRLTNRNNRSRRNSRWRFDEGHSLLQFSMSQEPGSIVGHDGKFKSCTSESFTIKRNGNLPEVTVNGFYTPSYGAGRPGRTSFNPNKSYMGFIILAINHKTKWYTDPNSPFRRRNYSPVEKRSFRSVIKPGYILMQETDYLIRHYKNEPSFHSMLFKDFTGKSIKQLESEGTFYFGLGFSYQLADLKIYFSIQKF